MIKKTSNIKMIESCSDCSIRVFMRAAYNQDYKGLILSGKPTKQQLQTAIVMISVEYADLSGLSQSDELDLSRKILYLDLRVKRNSILLHIQYESLDKIGMPCIGAFDKMNGYAFTWDNDNPDIENFREQLRAYQSNEKHYELELENALKEFMNTKHKGEENGGNIIDKRRSFLKQLNNIERDGYRIDKDKTSMEELALMVSDLTNKAEEQFASSSKTD